MKKNIIAVAILATTILSASAAQFLNVTSLVATDGNTKVTYERFYTDINNFKNLTGSETMTFRGNVNMQSAVTKGAMLSDSYITVTGQGASSTAGMQQDMSMKRYEAWKISLANYFTELAKQISAIGLI